MGLFYDKQAKLIEKENLKIKEVDEKIKKSMEQNPLLEKIVGTIAGFKETEPWIARSSGYYDVYRVVAFEEDAIKIQKYELKKGIGKDRYDALLGLEDVTILTDEISVFTYTLNGFVPLHKYKKEGITIPAKVVAWLWASIVRERMMVDFKECDFGEAHNKDWKKGVLAYFSYQVPYEDPELTFKDWF